MPPRPKRHHERIPIETSLETVALFSLKLAYEEEGLSPILRDDLLMGDYQRDMLERLVRREDAQTWPTT
ncbi:hypothetical protein [Pseudomonas allokribbensis]|uniref:hypothetical protein n=1 Tax=Pseudomonas allokribbensis TaxID=2774460 RepID=UPI0017886CA4|nr:hypothetical protein [Pseudomonas allokribbensis]